MPACAFCRPSMDLAVTDLLVAGQLGPFGQALQERERSVRRAYCGQRGAEGLHASVELACAFAVHLDDRAIEFEPGKDSASAGVAENLRAHLPVGVGGCMAADRAGGDAGIGAKLELAVEQVLHAALVHDQHDQVNGLSGNLESERPALHGEEWRT